MSIWDWLSMLRDVSIIVTGLVLTLSLLKELAGR